MAQNSSRRSGSSGSPPRREPSQPSRIPSSSKRHLTDAQLRQQAARISRTPLRSKVDYIQSATNPLPDASGKFPAVPPSRPVSASTARPARPASSSGTNTSTARPASSPVPRTRPTTARKPAAASRRPASSKAPTRDRVLKDPNGKDLHEPVDAVTVAERRRQLQRQARRKQRSTLRIVALAALAVLAVLAVTGIVVYNSSAFAITEVRVQGAQRLTAEHLTSLAAVSNETTLLRVDTAGIEQRLALDPWVMSATIRRDFPATLTLVITERPIEALVSILPSTATGTTAQWLVSSDGIWLSAANPSTEAGSVCANAWVPPSELLTLPQIKDVARTARPVEGDPISDEGILNTLTILTAFSPETRAMVQSVSAPDKIKTALTLRNHVQVSFGVAEDIPEKEAAMLALLKEFEGTITQINVRVANRATYKTT